MFFGAFMASFPEDQPLGQWSAMQKLDRPMQLAEINLLKKEIGV